MSDIDGLLKGAIDMHLHSEPFILPCIDAVEAAKQAKEVGMRGIVLKNQFYPTAPMAILAAKLVPDISVFGSVSLDYVIGGFNSYAVEASAKLGSAKVVWMPTLSSANSRRKFQKMRANAPRPTPGPVAKGDGYLIWDGNGELLPDIYEIISLVKEHDMILASGHISPAEVFALFDTAKKAGISKMVATHATNTEIVDESLSIEQQKQLAQMGVFIEHTAHDLMPSPTTGRPPEEIAEPVKAVGAQHCIISSDLGPTPTPAPVEGMKTIISYLLNEGITPEEIELMIKANPARLLDLD